MASELTVGKVGVGTAPYAPVTAEGAGTATGGAIGAEAVIVSKNTTAASHSAIAIDALDGYDSILYFGENGAERWNIRNDASDSDKFNIRDGSSTRLTIDSAGSVGIGVSPAAGNRLHVKELTANAYVKIETDKVDGIAAVEYLNDAQSFYTRVDASDNFTIRDGSAGADRLTIAKTTGLATFSNGINLGNTASATATTLDGYEEGTWTPALTGTTETIPSGYNVGKYVRIGSLVWINWYSGAMTLASSSSSAIITGLPFACIDAEASYSVFSYVFGNAVDGNSRGGYVNKNATTMTFADDNAADSSTFIDGSSKYLMVTAVYQTDEAF